MPCSQPMCVPVSSSCSRRKSARCVRGATSAATGLPLTVSATFMRHTPRDSALQRHRMQPQLVVVAAEPARPPRRSSRLVDRQRLGLGHRAPSTTSGRPLVALHDGAEEARSGSCDDDADGIGKLAGLAADLVEAVARRGRRASARECRRSAHPAPTLALHRPAHQVATARRLRPREPAMRLPRRAPSGTRASRRQGRHGRGCRRWFLCRQ